MSAQESGGRVEASRLGLALALVLTVVAIGAGTWMLGSDPADPADQRPASVVADFGAPERVRPPLEVAPPPADPDKRATRKADRATR